MRTRVGRDWGRAWWKIRRSCDMKRILRSQKNTAATSKRMNTNTRKRVGNKDMSFGSFIRLEDEATFGVTSYLNKRIHPGKVCPGRRSFGYSGSQSQCDLLAQIEPKKSLFYLWWLCRFSKPYRLNSADHHIYAIAYAHHWSPPDLPRETRNLNKTSRW